MRARCCLHPSLSRSLAPSLAHALTHLLARGSARRLAGDALELFHRAALLAAAPTFAVLLFTLSSCAAVPAAPTAGRDGPLLDSLHNEIAARAGQPTEINAQTEIVARAIRDRMAAEQDQRGVGDSDLGSDDGGSFSGAHGSDGWESDWSM